MDLEKEQFQDLRSAYTCGIIENMLAALKQKMPAVFPV